MGNCCAAKQSAYTEIEVKSQNQASAPLQPTRKQQEKPTTISKKVVKTEKKELKKDDEINSDVVVLDEVGSALEANPLDIAVIPMIFKVSSSLRFLLCKGFFL